jgi:hypothetical protein
MIREAEGQEAVRCVKRDICGDTKCPHADIQITYTVR